MHFPKDNTIEMYDIKNKRKFLNRTLHPNLPAQLLIGTKLQIHSRQHCIVDYGDDKTRKEHTGLNESCSITLKPGNMQFIGQIIQAAINNDLKVTNVRSVKLSGGMIGDVPAGNAAVFEIKGRGAVERVNSLIQKYPTLKNAAHVSPDQDAAARELDLLFNSGKLSGTSLSSDNCTCAVIKPHAMKRAGTIIDEILNQGFSIGAVRLLCLDRKEVEEFYEVYRDVVNEYSAMVDELSCGPCLILEIKANDTAHRVQKSFREFCGPADTKVAQVIRPDTLRAKFGVNKVQNAIHCTDLETDGAFECNFMFNVL